MIVERINRPPAFPPVEVKITFQSQKEIEAVFALFNHPKLCRFLYEHGIASGNVRSSLGEWDNYEVYSKLRDLINPEK